MKITAIKTSVCSEATAEKHPFKQEILHAGNAVLADGTIVDW